MTKAETFYVQTTQYNQFILITEKVEEIVRSLGIRDGMAFVMTNHTTTGITVNEGLECLEEDFTNFLSRLAPDDGDYNHARFLMSYGAMANNAPGHLKGLLCGNHAVFLVQEGKLKRRFAQEIYFCEFDGPQNRGITVSVMGD